MEHAVAAVIAGRANRETRGCAGYDFDACAICGVATHSVRTGCFAGVHSGQAVCQPGTFARAAAPRQARPAPFTWMIV